MIGAAKLEIRIIMLVALASSLIPSLLCFFYAYISFAEYLNVITS